MPGWLGSWWVFVVFAVSGGAGRDGGEGWEERRVNGGMLEALAKLAVENKALNDQLSVF